MVAMKLLKLQAMNSHSLTVYYSPTTTILLYMATVAPQPSSNHRSIYERNGTDKEAKRRSLPPPLRNRRPHLRTGMRCLFRWRRCDRDQKGHPPQKNTFDWPWLRRRASAAVSAASRPARAAAGECVAAPPPPPPPPRPPFRELCVFPPVRCTHTTKHAQLVKGWVGRRN